jgi:CHAT domain-containing protein
MRSENRSAISQPTLLQADKSVYAIAEQLLSCPDHHLEAWLEQNHARLSLELIQYLKDTYATADHIIENPELTERATRYGLSVAQQLSAEAAPLALATWARGIWATFNDPAEAVTLFRSALNYYRAINDQLSAARLLANLVGVLAECGANLEAEQCYHEAHSLLADLPQVEPIFPLSLEQNFGLLLHHWGRFEEALIVHDRALAFAQQHEFAIIAAEIQVNRCLTIGRIGRFGEMEAALLQARRVAAQHNQRLTVARIDLNLGELYTILGQPADALRYLNQSAQGFEASYNDMELSVVLALQATLLRQLGAWRVAYSHYQKALSVLEQHNLKEFQAETFVNLAICLRLLGSRKQLHRATVLLNQAHQFWSTNHNAYWLMRVALERICVAQAQNDEARLRELIQEPPLFLENRTLQAEFSLLSADLLRQGLKDETARQSIAHTYEAVLEFATQQGVLELRRKALYGLGKLYLETDWPQARQWLEAAAETDERIRQSLNLQELKASFHEQANDLFDDLIRAAYQRHEYTLVLLYGWRAKASAFLDLAVSARDELQFTPAQRQQIDQLRQQIASLRWALAKAAEKSLLDAHYEEVNPDLFTLEQQLLAVRRQSRQQQTPLSTLTVERLTQVLSEMEADLLLEYVRCGEELYGICANRAGVCTVVPLVDVETMATIANQLALTFHSFHALTQAERDKLIEARVAESQHLLKICYDYLIAPFRRYLETEQETSKILIAPCDTLSMLPFAAFWTGHNYWVEEQMIEVIQSGALILLERPQATQHSPAMVIATSTGQATAVRQEAAKLIEVLDACTLFIDAPVLTYLSMLPLPPRRLHIAAHTLQRGDAPFFTGIQLSGEVLSVEQSYDLPLWGTELVILSGCTTASGMESEASLFAFQSAFLIAGAQRLLCTLWPIADGMASAVLYQFYALLQQGITAPAALRQTQLQFLHHPTSDRHPALWATFTCIRR